MIITHVSVFGNGFLGIIPTVRNAIPGKTADYSAFCGGLKPIVLAGENNESPCLLILCVTAPSGASDDS
jgi:hypothetical protein